MEESFKCSIDRYFTDESEDTHNLYSDLIKLYEQIDPKGKLKSGFVITNYFNTLHRVATEKNLYESTITKPLDALYARYCARVAKYEPQSSNQVLLTLNPESFELGESLWEAIDCVAEEVIAKAEILKEWRNTTKMIFKVIVGPLAPVGAIFNGEARQFLFTWKRKDARRELAKEMRKLFDKERLKKNLYNAS